MFTHRSWAKPHFIGGAFVASKGYEFGTIDVIDAATEVVVARMPSAGRADVTAAVQAAQRAEAEAYQAGGL